MRCIKLNEDKRVISIRDNGESLFDGEIESLLGEIGETMLEDGTFTPSIVPKAEPTLEDKVAQLQSDNLILMDALAAMYEDMLAKGTV